MVAPDPPETLPRGGGSEGTGMTRPVPSPSSVAAALGGAGGPAAGAAEGGSLLRHDPAPLVVAVEEDVLLRVGLAVALAVDAGHPSDRLVELADGAVALGCLLGRDAI